MKCLEKTIMESLGNNFSFYKVYEKICDLIKKFVRSNILNFHKRKEIFSEMEMLINKGKEALEKDMKKNKSKAQDFLEYIKLDLLKLEEYFMEMQKSNIDDINLSNMRNVVNYDLDKDVNDVYFAIDLGSTSLLP